MIIKEKEKPIILRKLEALTRRLPKNHPKQSLILDHLAKRRAGYNGERSLNYYLEYFPSEKYHIFHDLRLHDGIHYFQIDVLILTRKFILLIEVKNISGTLQFDPIFNQLIRQQNEKEESFNDPLLQVSRHKSQLLTWLTLHKLPKIPIETLVVISSSNSTIKALSNQYQISQKVIHSDNFLEKFRNIEEKNALEIITEKELKKVSRLFIKKSEELDFNILHQYEICRSELLTGVFCQKCQFRPIKRIHGTWFCPICKYTSTDAFISALEDYALLISQNATNKEIRVFLQIESIFVTSRLLSNLNLPQTGKNKGRFYNLSNL